VVAEERTLLRASDRSGLEGVIKSVGLRNGGFVVGDSDNAR
jgi:hypothetical protein